MFVCGRNESVSLLRVWIRTFLWPFELSWNFEVESRFHDTFVLHEIYKEEDFSWFIWGKFSFCWKIKKKEKKRRRDTKGLCTLMIVVIVVVVVDRGTFSGISRSIRKKEAQHLVWNGGGWGQCTLCRLSRVTKRPRTARPWHRLPLIFYCPYLVLHLERFPTFNIWESLIKEIFQVSFSKFIIYNMGCRKCIFLLFSLKCSFLTVF